MIVIVNFILPIGAKLGNNYCRSVGEVTDQEIEDAAKLANAYDFVMSFRYTDILIYNSLQSKTQACSLFWTVISKFFYWSSLSFDNIESAKSSVDIKYIYFFSTRC